MNKSDLKHEVMKVISEKIPSLKLSESETRKLAKVACDSVFQVVVDSLLRGDGVHVKYFGNFIPVTRQPKRGRNPHTGQMIDVPERKSVSFKPSKTLKDKLNGDK